MDRTLELLRMCGHFQCLRFADVLGVFRCCANRGVPVLPIRAAAPLKRSNSIATG